QPGDSIGERGRDPDGVVARSVVGDEHLPRIARRLACQRGQLLPDGGLAVVTRDDDAQARRGTRDARWFEASGVVGHPSRPFSRRAIAWRRARSHPRMAETRSRGGANTERGYPAIPRCGWARRENRKPPPG